MVAELCSLVRACRSALAGSSWLANGCAAACAHRPAARWCFPVPSPQLDFIVPRPQLDFIVPSPQFDLNVRLFPLDHPVVPSTFAMQCLPFGLFAQSLVHPHVACPHRQPCHTTQSPLLPLCAHADPYDTYHCPLSSRVSLLFSPASMLASTTHPCAALCCDHPVPAP